MEVDSRWRDVVAEAVALGTGGHSCSQSVAVAFSRALGLDASLFLRMSSPLAGGMGLSGHVCGVVSAGLLVLGAACGPETAADAERSRRTMLLASEYMERFAGANGSLLCAELWTGPDPSTPDGARAIRLSGRPERLIRSGAEMLADILAREGAGR